MDDANEGVVMVDDDISTYGIIGGTSQSNYVFSYWDDSIIDLIRQQLAKLPSNYHYVAMCGYRPAVGNYPACVLYEVMASPDLKLEWADGYGPAGVEPMVTNKNVQKWRLYGAGYKIEGSFISKVNVNPSDIQLDMNHFISQNYNRNDGYPFDVVYPINNVATFNDNTQNSFGVKWCQRIYSDLGVYPDLRENKEEYSHATSVILASFGLYYLFRSLWRSIRGRLD